MKKNENKYERKYASIQYGKDCFPGNWDTIQNTEKTVAYQRRYCFSEKEERLCEFLSKLQNSNPKLVEHLHSLENHKGCLTIVFWEMALLHFSIIEITHVVSHIWGDCCEADFIVKFRSDLTFRKKTNKVGFTHMDENGSSLSTLSINSNVSNVSNDIQKSRTNETNETNEYTKQPPEQAQKSENPKPHKLPCASCRSSPLVGHELGHLVLGGETSWKSVSCRRDRATIDYTPPLSPEALFIGGD